MLLGFLHGQAEELARFLVGGGARSGAVAVAGRGASHVTAPVEPILETAVASHHRAGLTNHIGFLGRPRRTAGATTGIARGEETNVSNVADGVLIPSAKVNVTNALPKLFGILHDFFFCTVQGWISRMASRKLPPGNLGEFNKLCTDATLQGRKRGRGRLCGHKFIKCPANRYQFLAGL
jgi:hypothetical protein